MRDLIFSLAPILWLVLALSVLKMSAWKATVTAAAIGLGIAALFFRVNLPLDVIPSVAAEGVAFALCPICLVILAALFVYAVTIESGAMTKIREGLSGLSSDRRVIALLIVWGFGNFMEGMAGFGTAVAIPAAILVGLGFNPLKAVLMCLIANTVPTVFGSVGVPCLTLARVSGASVSVVAGKAALLQLPIILLSPLAIIFVESGLHGFKGIWKVLLIADFAFTIPWLCVSYFLGCELPDVLGGVAVMLAIAVYETRGNFRGDFRAQVFAWAPFGLVVLFLGVSTFLPPEMRLTPGALVLIAGLIGGLFQHLSPFCLVRLLLKTLRAYAPAFITICGVLVLARVMTSAGMIALMARALVRITGSAYPFFAPAVGALGSFVTGSGTNANVLFGALQADAAAQLGVSRDLLAAANVMGAGIGKIICPQSIAIGTAAAAIPGAASDVFRRVFPAFLTLLLLAGLITGLANLL